MQTELPMGAVVPSGQAVHDSDPRSMAKVPEGQSMCRVLQAGAGAVALRLTCRGQSRS